jgi:hypothetical protein
MVIPSAKSMLTPVWWILSVITLIVNSTSVAIATSPPLPYPTITPETTSPETTSPETTSPETKIINKAEFGVSIVNLAGKHDIFPTTNIPFKVGNSYGWRIKLNKNYHGLVTWREVFHLPKPPEAWATDHSENFVISKDGATATSQHTEKAPEDGIIENFWQITPGDPTGEHKIEVYVNQNLVATFNFQIKSIK